MVIVIQVAVLVPQVFDAVTQMFPPVAPKVTVILVVPCPELMVAPPGTVHVYDVAPLTGLIEYVNV